VGVLYLGRQRGVFTADRLRNTVADVSVILYHLSRDDVLTRHDVSHCLARKVGILRKNAYCLECRQIDPT